MVDTNIEYNVSFISFIRKLSENEITILCYLLNEMDWTDDQNIAYIPANELFDLLKIENNEQNKKLIDSCLKKIISAQISSDSSIFNIIYSIQYDFESIPILVVEFSPLLKQNFLFLIKTIAIVPLHLIGKFSSNQSAFLFWKLCEEYCKHRNIFNFDVLFTTEQTKKIFGIGENQYVNSKKSNMFARTTFEKNVIYKSIDEINYLKLGMTIACKKEKNGKQVTGYRFIVSMNNINKIFQSNMTNKIRIQLFGKEE